MGHHKRRFLRLLLPFVAVSLSWGASITASSYSVQNGELGLWGYTDSAYLPCPGGNCYSPLTFLSGGTGLLTDGDAPAFSWDGSGLSQGSYLPWVGWHTINPTIHFDFSGAYTISRVGLYFDNTPWYGDVRLPSSVVINGQTFDIPEDPSFGPAWVYIDIAPTTANALDLTLYRNGADTWQMLGEVNFEGAAVPEPAALVLLPAGLLLLVFRRRLIH